jgi:hypothetical protein
LKANRRAPGPPCVATAGQLTSARNCAADFQGQPAARIVTDAARQTAEGRQGQSTAGDLNETTQTLQKLSATEVTAELTTIFPADALRLFLFAPPAEGIKPARPLAIYTKSASKSVKNKVSTEEILRFRYENFGVPGTVASSRKSRISISRSSHLPMARDSTFISRNLRPGVSA